MFMAVTRSVATDARKAFPFFDGPQLKGKNQRGQTLMANMPIIYSIIMKMSFNVSLLMVKSASNG